MFHHVALLSLHVRMLYMLGLPHSRAPVSCRLQARPRASAAQPARRQASTAQPPPPAHTPTPVTAAASPPFPHPQRVPWPPAPTPPPPPYQQRVASLRRLRIRDTRPPAPPPATPSHPRPPASSARRARRTAPPPLHTWQRSTARTAGPAVGRWRCGWTVRPRPQTPPRAAAPLAPQPRGRVCPAGTAAAATLIRRCPAEDHATTCVARSAAHASTQRQVPRTQPRTPSCPGAQAHTRPPWLKAPASRPSASPTKPWSSRLPPPAGPLQRRVPTRSMHASC